MAAVGVDKCERAIFEARNWQNDHVLCSEPARLASGVRQKEDRRFSICGTSRAATVIAPAFTELESVSDHIQVIVAEYTRPLLQ